MFKILFNTLILLACSSTWANPLITKTSRKSAIAEFETAPEVGERYYSTDNDGNKIGILEVSKVKGKKALLNIIWGSAFLDTPLTKLEKDTVLTSQDIKGLRLEGPTSTPPPITLRPSDYLRSDKNSLGIMGGLSYGRMNARVKDSFGEIDTVQMSGISLNVYGYYDYLFTPTLGLRAAVSYDQIRLNGNSSLYACNGRTSQSCNANLDFISGELMLKYQTTFENYRAWLGAGYYYRYATNASSSAVDTSNFYGDSAYALDIGLDIGTKLKRYVPISIEYVKPSSSTDVTSDLIYLRIGYAFF